MFHKGRIGGERDDCKSEQKSHPQLRLIVLGMKGGPGKTTTTANLIAAARGQRVLAIDCDPQGNLTYYLTRILPWLLTPTVGTAIEQYAASDHSIEAARDIMNHNIISLSDPSLTLLEFALTSWGKVDLLACNDICAGLQVGSQLRLLDELINSVENDYDLIILDGSPTITSLTLSALYAARKIFCVVKPTNFSILGLANLLRTIQSVQQHHDNLYIVGVIANLVNERKKQAHMKQLEALKNNPMWKLAEPVILDRAIFERAENAHLPVHAMGGAEASHADHSYKTLLNQAITAKEK